MEQEAFPPPFCLGSATRAPTTLPKCHFLCGTMHVTWRVHDTPHVPTACHASRRVSRITPNFGASRTGGGEGSCLAGAENVPHIMRWMLPFAILFAGNDFVFFPRRVCMFERWPYIYVFVHKTAERPKMKKRYKSTKRHVEMTWGQFHADLLCFLNFESSNIAK